MNKFLQRIIIKNRTPTVLWIDHSLGGGTSTYSKNQFKQMHHKNRIIRLQYFPRQQLYRFTEINTHNAQTADSLEQVYQTCQNIAPSEIVVNNLVGYRSTLDMLNLVTKLKQKNNDTRVSFRGHDFQCICPSYNLINSNGVYCDCQHTHGCETCWRAKRLSPSDDAHNILKSGATSIQKWRSTWEDFLTNTTDDIIVFSNSTKEILQKAYPITQNKITVIPHSVKKYPRVKIKSHSGINIAVLGHISHAKGASVVHEISNILPQCPDVKIIVIGTIDNTNSNIIIHGRYKSRSLPKIMQKYQIDLVFIPSIWPETFSYTTSEAISMGLPVACYNIGAPAERVLEYDMGLVLDKISPSENLADIIKFIYKLREQK